MRGLIIATILALTATKSFAYPPQCPPAGTEEVLLPNPADCTTFYKCTNGVLYLMQCPGGLEWNDKISQCDYPEDAQCEETEVNPTWEPTENPTTVSPTTVTGPTTTSKPRPDKCPDVDGPEDVLLPNPSDCSSFFKCLNGEAHLINCPPGQEWSIALNRCDYPSIAQCVPTENPGPSSTSTTRKPPVERPDKCPPENGPEDVLLPNPYDCNSFFKCLDGIPHLIPCPEGQQWSIDLNRCDYPTIAQCVEKDSDESDEDDKEIIPILPETRPQENGCPAEDGPEDVLLPNPADCGSFYKCLAGTPVLHKCPPGLQWSTELTRCEYPDIAQCVETESSVKPETTTAGQATSSKPPVERPDHCPAEDGPEDVLLPNPEDCGSFFKCSGGHPELIACPQGLHWSIELNRCEYPAVAKCENKYFIKLLLRDSECPDHNEGMDIFFPNPKDCSTYYQCSNGVKILKECGVGTLWDVNMQRCDHANVAKCATEEAVYIPMKPRFFAAQENGCPDHNEGMDIFFPNPKDCSTYYQCSNGVKILKECGVGTLWDVDMQRCDHANVAKCATEEAVYIPMKPRFLAAQENGCPAEDGPEDVLLPNPADCGSFYKCLAGTPVLHKCPPGLQWSTELTRCEYPDIAQCVETESSVKPETTTAGQATSAKPPVERPDHCPAEDGPEDVLLPNPEDCGSFFKCLGGHPELIPCPQGLHWSIELNRCDYPAVAKCENKLFIKLLLRDSECPDHNEGMDIFFPNPKDCATYYQCSNGVKILKECGVGTLWDVNMQRCDHANVAECAVEENTVIPNPED